MSLKVVDSRYRKNFRLNNKTRVITVENMFDDDFEPIVAPNSTISYKIILNDLTEEVAYEQSVHFFYKPSPPPPVVPKPVPPPKQWN